MSTDRRSRILQGIDIRRARGLEIGPLVWPLVRKDEGDITYVDHVTTEELRSKYARNKDVPADLIVDVDAVWGAETLAEAVGGRRFDYILASHVVEHVPDLIGWIGELLEVLEPDGEIRLAVPDRRYTFDYHRRETRLADVLAAHVVKARLPQPQQILEFHTHFAALDAAAAWAGAVPTPPVISSQKRESWMDRAQKPLRGEYEDVHCWVFTPRSWALLMMDMDACGLLPCECSLFHDTQPGAYEFTVGLRRGSGGWERMAHETQGKDSVEDRLRGEITALRESTSWRITAPLRWVASVVRRR